MNMILSCFLQKHEENETVFQGLQSSAKPQLHHVWNTQTDLNRCRSHTWLVINETFSQYSCFLFKVKCYTYEHTLIFLLINPCVFLLNIPWFNPKINIKLPPQHILFPLSTVWIRILNMKTGSEKGLLFLIVFMRNWLDGEKCL